jgi:hypothetical protein
MEHKIIYAEKYNYLLVIDNSEIKVGDWIYAHNEFILWVTETNLISNQYCRKIISHLPLKDAVPFKGVDLLPPLEEDDVEKLAMDQLESKWNYLYQFGYPKKPYPSNYENDLNMVMVGIYKTKEKYKYSEDNLMKAIILSATSNTDFLPDRVSEIIESLNQPKIPISFNHTNTIRPDTGDLLKEVPAQWVGKYTY